ncbi:MAG: response regulator receiver domain [Gammaproteobacteria bacterium]|nr:response regulator receiver domain [Gammaproteobacteria bacterium]
MSEYYCEFIKEAFIHPIRSVLIVDDSYPTYDEVLCAQHLLNTGKKPDYQKGWYKNPKQVRGTIRKFRENDPPLLVDVHDGMNIDAEAEKKIARHLHQSDLLVLDYELDQEKPEDGTQAIGILRNLMANDHFNLVVIYTSKNLDHVFSEVRWGLASPCLNFLCENEETKATELIQEAEDEIQNLSDLIEKSIAEEQYFHSRLYSSSYLRTMGKGNQPYSEFFDLAGGTGWNPEERKLVLRYALNQFEKSHLKVMNTEACNGDLVWSTKSSSRSAKWIKSKSVFICFSRKSNDDDLLNQLQVALNDWGPNPSRLFLAKLRAAMDEYGVVAQTQALSSKYALAYWYNQLLYADPLERRWHVAESISRHSDQLMETVLPKVRDFAKRLIDAEVKEGTIQHRCKDHFKVNLGIDQTRTRAALEHNALVCSRNPEGWHLTTGHIFSMCNEYWLCLSPACDMVPSQISKWQRETFGEGLPFMAIKLQQCKKNKVPSDVQSNRYLFLRFKDDVQIHCFNDPSGDASSPHWDTLYAKDAGKFNGEDFRFMVWRTEKDESELVLRCHEAEVVSQLRYEYALNLIHKLGVSLTRIGLGFSDGKPKT